MRERYRERGFALLVVLWVLVVLSVMIVRLAAGGRVDAQLARNFEQSSRAEALADGGVAQAVWLLTQAPEGARWNADGTEQTLRLPEGRMIVSVTDEAGKIDLNHASPILLAALFRALGADDDEAARLGGAVKAWVTPFRPEDPAGAMAIAPYRAAGLPYGPAGGPMQDLDELRYVIGMPKSLAATARRYLTLWSEAAEPDRRVAPEPVRAALTLASAAEPLAAAPPAVALRIVNIVSTGLPAGGGRFTREAVVRLGDPAGRSFEIVAWSRKMPPLDE